MSKQILHQMNKDINHLYHNQKEDIKDLCQIQRRTNSILKPSLLFVLVSLILCFHIYQIQQPVIQNPNQITEPTTQENKNSTNNTYSSIGDEEATKESSQKKSSTEATVEEQSFINEKTTTDNQSSQYIGIYCLSIFDLMIIIYIFLKKTNKI